MNSLVSKEIKWICDICKTRFEDKKEAKRCESLGNPTIQFKEGDTVIDAQGLMKPMMVQKATVVRVEAQSAIRHQVFYTCKSLSGPQTYTLKPEEIKPAT